MTRTPIQQHAASAIVDRIFDAADHLELAAAFYDAQSLPPVDLRRAMRALARVELPPDAKREMEDFTHFLMVRDR